MGRLKTGVSTLNSALKDALQGDWTAIGQIITGVWEGIKNGIKNSINSIIGFINKMLSGVTNGMNAVINALNSISFDIPDWVPLLGGKTFGLNLKQITALQIPTLAKGGVLTAPTLGLMGEYAGANSNPEIVTPQNLLTDIINESNGELASVYAQIGRQIVSAIENKDLEVTIGDDTIARSAARGNQAYYKRTGKDLLAV